MRTNWRFWRPAEHLHMPYVSPVKALAVDIHRPRA